MTDTKVAPEQLAAYALAVMAREITRGHIGEHPDQGDGFDVEAWADAYREALGMAKAVRSGCDKEAVHLICHALRGRNLVCGFVADLTVEASND